MEVRYRLCSILYKAWEEKRTVIIITTDREQLYFDIDDIYYVINHRKLLVTDLLQYLKKII